jgi:hypothetical protein
VNFPSLLYRLARLCAEQLMPIIRFCCLRPHLPRVAIRLCLYRLALLLLLDLQQKRAVDVW